MIVGYARTSTFEQRAGFEAQEREPLAARRYSPSRSPQSLLDRS